MGWLAQLLRMELPRPDLRTAREDLQFLDMVAKRTDELSPPPRATETPTPRPRFGEQGSTGSLNYGGNLRNENNRDLYGFAGLGQPGVETWGVYERLRLTDPAVAKGLEMVTGPIRSAEVEVEPGGEDEKSIAIAEFVRDNFQSWLEPTWQEFADQVIKTKLTFGFSLHEEVWDTRPDKRVPGGTAVYLRKMAQRLPSSLTYNAWHEEDGELVGIRQLGFVKGSFVNVELPASKTFLVSWNRGGNNYVGYSALRSIYRVSETRSEILRILGIGVQREMLGVPVGNVDKDAELDEPRLKDLQKTLENLTAHENAAIVGLPGVDIGWLYSPVANKGHAIELYEKLGLVILQTLFAEQSHLGTSGTGSRAVGEIHVDAAADFIKGVAANFEAQLNGVGSRVYTGPVRKLVDFNFGPQDKYPVISLTLKKAQLKPLEKAQAIAALVPIGGITVMAEDENNFRDDFGMGPIDPEARKAELEKRKQEKADAAQAQLDAMKAAGAGKPGQPPPNGPPNKLSDVQTFAPPRALRPTEQHLALGEMDAFHTSARTEFETHAKEIAKRMVRGAAPAIKAAMADPSKLAGLALDGTTLSKMVEVFVERARNFGFAQAAKEKKRQPAGLVRKRERGEPGVPAMGSLALREYARVFRLEEDDKTEAAPTGPAVEKLVKAQTQLVTNRIKQRLKSQIQDEVINTARTGGNAADVLDVLDGDIDDTGAFRTDAGFVTARSFSMGREEFFAEHADEIAGVERSAVLDRNVCDHCEAMDGTEWDDLNDPDRIDALPPDPNCEGGQNCRCLDIVLYDGGSGFQKVDEE